MSPTAVPVIPTASGKNDLGPHASTMSDGRHLALVLTLTKYETQNSLLIKILSFIYNALDKRQVKIPEF